MKNQDNLFSLYREHGIACVPTGYHTMKDGTSYWHKYPMVNWKPYINALPSIEECELWDSWFAAGECGIAMVCGEGSGVIAVDFDTGNLLHAFPEGTCKKVGKRFETRFYTHNKETYRKYKLPGGQGKDNDAELLTDGRIVMLPPSFHSNTGKRYHWVGQDLLTAELTDLDPEILKKLDEQYGYKETYQAKTSTFYYPIEFVDDLLAYIPCDQMTREEWVHIGMGLDDCYGDAGFPYWDKWSSTDKSIGTNGANRYDPQGIRRIWNSFDSDKETKRTMQTVVDIAMKYGYSEPPIVFETPEAPTDTIEGPTYPITPLSESIIDAAPDLLGRITQDIYRTAPVPNKHMAFAAAIGAMAAMKAHRIKGSSGLRPVACIIAIGSSGSGKQHPMDYVKEMFDSIRNDNKTEEFQQDKETCFSWLTGYPGSGPGVSSAINSGVRLLLVDEIGKHFSDGKRQDQEFQRIMTAITELATASNGKHLGRAYANADGKRPQVNLKFPHLNVVGYTNYKDIWPAISQIKFTTGTWERFSFIFGRDGISPEASLEFKPVDPTIVRDLFNFTVSFLKTDGTYELKTMKVSESGERLIKERSRAFKNIKFPDIEAEICNGFVNRYVAKVIQLCLIAWDGVRGAYSQPVPDDVIAWACDVISGILGPFLAEAIPNHCCQSEDKELRDSVKKYVELEKWGKNGVPKTMVSRHFKMSKGIDLANALSRLVEQGFILEDKVILEGAKKPTTFYKKGIPG